MVLGADPQHTRWLDPNSAEAIAARQAALDRAWCPSPPDRATFVRQVCRGRRVLDLGCAGQATKEGSDAWLHRVVRCVAQSCVGADYEREEVQRLRNAGYDVVFADVCAGPGELTEREPFDVVVAGELIEHLSAPQALFEFATAVLRPGGRLLITTPNPFAPLRTTLGRRRTNRDNVDHVVYLFPSGIVEMAQRTGFELRSATTTAMGRRRDIVWAGVKAELWHWRHRREPRNWWIVPLADVAAALGSWKQGQLGETAIYLLELAGPAA